MQLLRGKHALITGGNTGIGRVIAENFIEQGARVSIVARDQNLGDETVLALNAQAQSDDASAFYLADLLCGDQLQQALFTLQKERGFVDIAINNAGIKRDGLLFAMDDLAWDDVLAINLKAVFAICRALVRPMIKKRTGSIINISSVSGLVGNPGQCNYSAAKAGVIGLTRSLAREVAKKEIRVNAICPGFIDTPMTSSMKQSAIEKIVQSIPMGHMGSAQDIAHAAVFLSSHWASYITGQTLTIDGGLIA